MARLGFTALAALVAGVALAVWVAPEASLPPEAPTTTSEREVLEPVTAPVPELPAPVAEVARAEEAAPPVEVPEPVSSLGPVTGADAAPPSVGVPTLPEEQREIGVMVGFEPDLGDAPGEDSEAAPAPVDPEQSGELIRRMLALYRQMGD